MFDFVKIDVYGSRVPMTDIWTSSDVYYQVIFLFSGKVECRATVLNYPLDWDKGTTSGRGPWPS